MKRYFFLLLLSLVLINGCENKQDPVLKGKINLSSQLLGVDAYFLYGYNFNNSEFIKYSFPFSGSTFPDLINIPFKHPNGSLIAPGFNAPSGLNGFHLLGEFASLNEAKDFYNDYLEAEPQLNFKVDSDTVRLYQVWLQKTQLDHYAKMLITEIDYYNDGLGEDYIVVSIDYVFQNDGSTIFP